MRHITFAASAVLAISGSLSADTVNSAIGTFSPFPTGFASSTPAWSNYSTPPVISGSPFWNNPSGDTGVDDSHAMNIGYVLTDTGGLAGTTPVLGTDTVTQDFTAGGGDPTAFNFVSSATAYNIALRFADSSLDTGNAAQGTVFGYYIGDTYTPLFAPTGTTSPTGDIPFDPTTSGTSYGFYATVCYGAGQCETYTTGNGNSGNAPGAAGWNHFALFELASGSYVIAFEDTDNVGGEGLGDFNDVVVELQVVTSPEPGTIFFVAVGLTCLILWGRRRYLDRSGARS
jgi:hypothetical protein